MILSKLDLFSSHFSFNTGNSQTKRGTLFGAVLSFAVSVTTIAYFIYIFLQYITNQIDPTFRSQSLISQGLIQTELSSDLIGFRFEDGSSSYDALYPKNQTYLVYLAYFQYTSPDVNLWIPLNITDCTNPDLLGFMCLDFSNMKNYTLFLDTNKNMKSTIQIQTYGCRDIDTQKTTVPDNCAEQSLIDNMINGINSIMRFKIYTSQFNTATQMKEVNYRNAYVYTIANQQILTQLKTQVQNTSIKQGFIVQSQTNFSSPIQYTQSDQSIDRNYALTQIGAGSYSLMILMVDEIVQHIYIQYPTLPQVLALVSSIFTLLMMIGIFGRIASQKSIQQDFLMLFLKSMYQDKYLGILKKCNNDIFIEQQQIQQDIQTNQENLISRLQRQSEAKETKDVKLQETYQYVDVPAFMELQSNNDNPSQNIKNLYLSSNNDQQNSNYQSPQSVYLSIQEKNKFDEINLENSNKIKHQIDEGQFEIEQSSIIQKNKFQKQNFQSQNTSNNNHKKPNFKKSFDGFVFKFSNINHKAIEINKANLIENLKTIQDINCSNKIQQDFRKIRKKMKDINKKQMQKIEEQIRKDMNVFNFIKDIILIKKAVMMILTKDQLAALHLVSCSQNFLDFDLDSSQSDTNGQEQRQNLSHYEQQHAILQSAQFQNEYLQDFLLKFSDTKDKSINEIDRRILSSIQKCHLN